MKKLLLLFIPLLLLGFSLADDLYPVHGTAQESRARTCRPLPSDYFTNAQARCLWHYPHQTEFCSDYGIMEFQSLDVDGTNQQTYINDECFAFLGIPLPTQNPLLSVQTEIEKAVERMHDEGITIYDNVKDYSPNRYVTREEAAKLFSLFALTLGQDDDTALDCSFNDIDLVNSDLRDDVIRACQLGIMKGFHNNFSPKAGLKNNEAMTMLIRIVEGPMEEPGSQYRINYYNKGVDMGLFSSYHRNISMQRGDIAIYFFEYMFPEYRNNQNDAQGS